MKAVDVATMRSIDRRAVKEYGMRSVVLMENAGRGIADVVLGELALLKGATSSARAARVSIIAGKGNNGGDGFVAARHLKNAGVDVTIYLLAEIEALTGDAAINAVIWKRMGGCVNTITTERAINKYASALKHSAVIIDAMLGIGISEPVGAVFTETIELVNSVGKLVVAVDLPSGIEGSTGAVLGVAVRADVTATVCAAKTGLYSYPARDYAGRIEVVDIGIPAELLDEEAVRWNVTGPEDLGSVLSPRAVNSHKGSFGHLLVVAGSPGKSGAAFLAATSAMRAGVGLATLALPKSLNPVMEVKSTEVMTLALPESKNGCLSLDSFDVIAAELSSKSALVVGPGLGTAIGVKALVELLVKSSKVPIVVDADGLNAIGGRCDALKEAQSGLVITPHPGEAARLLGISSTEVQADRIGAAEKLVELTSAVVVLKGACTITAAPNGTIYFNTTGNAGLASAGTGDVLAGMIGAFLARGNSALRSALSAVYLHGAVADRIKKRSGECGMMAMDLIDELPAVLNSFCSDD